MAKRKSKIPKPTDAARGWGMRVGGPHPYLADVFSTRKEEAVEQCSEPYHRVVKVKIVLDRRRK